MNTDTIKGKWNQLKGDLKSKWGQITDDEFTQIGGDKDKLIGKIQEKYGRTRDEVSREVHEFLSRHSGGTTNTGQQKTGQNPPMQRTPQQQNNPGQQTGMKNQNPDDRN